MAVLSGSHNSCSSPRDTTATTTTVLLAIAAGILGLLGGGHSGPLTRVQLPLTAFLVVLGVFGAFFSAKYHDRFEFHMFRGREYRDALETNLPGLRGSERRHSADVASRAKYPWLHRRRLYAFWVLLHLLVAAIGVTLTLSILLSSFSYHILTVLTPKYLQETLH